ncbi:ABC-2 transporter permease [Dysosmobacter sp.]|uniref:ABC-2 transporter permease n=1 Tax=Dysosmobacter sp. TaxID=2591382 RepID=UPI002A8650C1|nr:ABC-2 transporter permease [Dysosmobacter sp.]MDY3282090.1 ABC-2 transporter permease [Dysosmobacter sp.]
MKLKALLRKDLYVLGRQGVFLLVITVAFAAIPTGYFNTFAILFASIIPFSVINDDERTHWGRMAAMMPYSPGEIVLSRYLLGWGCAAFDLAVAVLIQLLERPFMAHRTELPLLAASFCLAVCLMAVTIPLIIRFGTTRARLINMVVIASICVCASLLGDLEVPAAGSLSVPWFGPMIAAAALTALSIPLSLRWYCRKEK